METKGHNLWHGDDNKDGDKKEVENDVSKDKKGKAEQTEYKRETDKMAER